jgi:N-acyl homoserine lactone hydrolase
MSTRRVVPSNIVTLHLADVTFPPEHPLAGQTGVVNAFVVRHEHRLVLVDTGVGFGNAEIEQYYQPVLWRLADVFAEHGWRLEDVNLLINTHLHFDHCGQNGLFPAIPIYVQSADYAAAHQPDFTILEWVEFPSANYQQLSGDREILPGLTLMATPGHTPGHQSIVIETSEGRVIISGQAVYSAHDFEQLLRTGELTGDPRPQSLASAQRLVQLKPQRVLFSHDSQVWNEKA